MSAPELEVQGVLRRHWEDSATDLGSTPPIHTGKYDRGDGDVPAVTITGGNEGPVAPGQTGYTGLDGQGRGGMQRLGGAVTVNCVAGTYDDLRGAGASGENLNPKKLRWQLYDHASQLLVDHQLNTDLMSVSPGEATKIVESFEAGDDVEYVFRIEFRAQYLRDRHPR